MLLKLRLLTLLLFLLLIPLASYGAESIYTYQTGSFAHIEDAQKQFDHVANQLNKTDIDHLRIEKIGKFYSVRLGKFANKQEAIEYAAPIKKHVSQYLLMKAYYKEERIEKLFQLPKNKQPEPEEEVITSPVPVRSKPSETKEKASTKQTSVKSKPSETKEKASTNQASVKSKPPITREELNANRRHIKSKPQLSESGWSRLNNENQAMPENDQKLLSGLVKKKKYKEALEFIRPKLTENPEDSGMNGWYGSILLKLEQPDVALPYLRKASESSPEVADYYNAIGYCQFYLNNFHDAINEFNKAISIDPSYVDALAGLGATYANLGQRDNAMDIYSKLRKLDTNSAYKLIQIINKM